MLRLIQRALLTGIAGLLLTGCAAQQQPTPARQAPANTTNTILQVAELLDGRYDQAAVTVIGPVWQAGTEARLVGGLLPNGGGGFAPAAGAGPVLIEGVELRGLRAAPLGGYGVARLSGTVGVGADGGRRIVASEAKVLQPVALGLAELLANSATYEGQVVAVDGSLLANQNSALLVDSIGPGGVPAGDSQQIKLAEPAPGVSILRDGSGSKTSVRQSVRATGLWQANRLTVFWIEAP
ncbi:MAG TPA: hypothetical protein VGE07_13765 [Herpetosiphonaceae bacterium]